jgi:hypothetical protein
MDNVNRQEIWNTSHRANISKGLMDRMKSIYDKCENSVVICMDGKNSESSKLLHRSDREEFYVLCCSTW